MKNRLEELRRAFADQWADLFIVSDVEVSQDGDAYARGMDTSLPGVRVLVSEAKGEKCQRCWKHHPKVGADALHPGLCPRCAQVIRSMEGL